MTKAERGLLWAIEARFIRTGKRSRAADVVATVGGDAGEIEPVLLELARRGLLRREVDTYTPSARRLRQLIVAFKRAGRSVLVHGDDPRFGLRYRTRAELSNLVYADAVL